ncbi:MAG: hypothetical protein NT087_03235 [Deltaproteobacteria bacterium]|nr:hypothetical protein [Deltaproteobacteria bacterium]
MADNKEIKVIIGGNADRLAAELEKAKVALSSFHQSTQKSGLDITNALDGVHGALSNISTVAIALAAGAGLKHLVDDAVNWNNEARILSNNLGLSSEQASVFAVALHGLGIENESAVGAALKLSLVLSKGTDKFDQFGIAVKDANGQLLSIPEIMANVNKKLLETEGDTDRNIIAMTIYGRKWKEVQEIRRLTPEELHEAEELANKLHLIVTPEDIARTMAYKKSMNELHLVSEAYGKQIGEVLIPFLTKLSNSFIQAGVSGIDVFSDDINVAVTSVKALLDVIPGWMFEAGGVFGAIMYGKPGVAIAAGGLLIADWVKDMSRLAALANAGVVKWTDVVTAGHDDRKKMLADFEAKMRGGNDKPKNPPDNKNKLDLDSEDSNRLRAAREKHLEYLKASQEAGAAVVKASAQERLEINKNEYSWGLLDLKTYLAEKHALTEKELSSELAAKQKELANRQADVADFKPDKGKADSENAKFHSEALLKVEVAQKAVTEAESKLTIAKTQGREETKKLTFDTQRGYQEMQAALLDLTGDYVGAAAIRTKLDEESVARQKLITEASAGDAEAQKALWATEEMAQIKSSEAANKLLREYKEIQASLLDLTGDYVGAAAIRTKLDEESLPRQNLIKAAMAGNAEAQKAFWAAEEMDAKKASDAAKKAASEKAQILLGQISSQMQLVNAAEKFYAITTGEAAEKRISLLQQELAAHQSVQDSIIGNEPTAILARQQEQAAIDGINEKLLDQRKIIADMTAEGGAIKGLQEYGREALNLGAQITSAVTDVMKGMEDSMVTFVRTGKLSFSSLADSIINDFIRIQVRQNITGPMAAGGGGLFSSLAGFLGLGGTSSATQNPAEAGAGAYADASEWFAGVHHLGGTVGDSGPKRAVSPALFVQAPRLHSGLAPDEFPAILQRGEQVLSRKQVAQNAAEQNPQNITINVSVASGTPDDVRRAAASGARSALSVLSGAQRFA